MTNGEWLEQKLEKIGTWFARYVWWFILVEFILIVTLFVLYLISGNVRLVVVQTALVVFSVGPACVGVRKWIAFERKE